ncbi:MAG: hypothetical protein ACOYEV_10955 [Candidatus Nanopelagicales bacterium]
MIPLATPGLDRTAPVLPGQPVLYSAVVLGLSALSGGAVTTAIGARALRDAQPPTRVVLPARHAALLSLLLAVSVGLSIWLILTNYRAPAAYWLPMTLLILAQPTLGATRSRAKEAWARWGAHWLRA